MLTTLSTLLAEAEQGNYAVIAPDFISLFMARTILECAEELQAPLILSYATALKPVRDLQEYARFIQVVRAEAESATVPVVLHLDHATQLDEIAEAIQLGFTSVMLDASFEPYPINLERTRKCVEMAAPAGVSVEAELGHVPTSKEYLIHQPETEIQPQNFFTDPHQAVEFVAATGIDALAIAIGTVHGPYKGKPQLDFNLLAQLHEMIKVPLVLHGASGLSEAELHKAISLGIRKINVYTEIFQAALSAAALSLEKEPNNPLAFALAQASGVRKVIEKYIGFSKSIGAAGKVLG